MRSSACRKSVFDKLLRIPNFLQKFGILPLLNAPGTPDGSPAHTPSLRNIGWMGFSTVWDRKRGPFFFRQGVL